MIHVDALVGRNKILPNYATSCLPVNQCAKDNTSEEVHKHVLLVQCTWIKWCTSLSLSFKWIRSIFIHFFKKVIVEKGFCWGNFFILLFNYSKLLKLLKLLKFVGHRWRWLTRRTTF